MDLPKQRASKLDPHAAPLEQWLTGKDDGGDGLTLQAATGRLFKESGLKIHSTAVGKWWKARRAELAERLVLQRISSGARQCHEVEAQFAKDPAPELETLFKLMRVIVMNFRTNAHLEPGLLKLVIPALKTVIEYAKMLNQEEDRTIAWRKLELLQLDVAKDTLTFLPKLKKIAGDDGLDDEAKAESVHEPCLERPCNENLPRKSHPKAHRNARDPAGTHQ